MEMDTESKSEKQKSFYIKLPVLIVIAVIVGIGLYLVFSQFNMDRVESDYLTHTQDAGAVFFELDSNGNKVELGAVYGEAGFLEEIIGSEFLDSVRSSDTRSDTDAQRHRIGYSRLLTKNIEFANLTAYLQEDISYIIFLDDMIIFSDFSESDIALGSMQFFDEEQQKPIQRLAQVVSIFLPYDYVGMTLTVIEFITPEQAEWWYPVMFEITTSDAEGLSYIIMYGPLGVLSGSIGAVVILITVLLALQMFGGKKTWWLLLLPIIYGILAMVRMALIPFYSGWQHGLFQNMIDYINTFAVFCGGNLLLIFLAFRMSTRLRFILIAITAVHFMVTAYFIIYRYVSYEYAFLYDMPWLSVIGFVCIVFAFVLMILERKENRYFKQCLSVTLVFVIGYALITIITRFTNYSMYLELVAPIAVVGVLSFFNLNDVLYLLILLLAIVFSIDEYISEMAERRSRLSALELTNQMKTEFLGNMSHELKTPLTSVSVLGKHSFSVMTEDWQQGDAGSDEMRDNVQIIDELRDNLRIIVVESDRMRRIVDDLLNVAAIEQGDFTLRKEYFSFPDLMQEIGETQFKALNVNKNELKFSFAPDLPMIYADRDRIREVLLNLISNATRHTNDGSITITAKQVHKRIMISVSDTGEGIPEELQKSLFRRFLGADIGRAHGTGLGLYICKQIIEVHGGNIRLESKQGSGTTVYIELPLEGERD